MSGTDACARCGGDCPLTGCPECGECENTGAGGTFRECPACTPAAAGPAGFGEDEPEPCAHVCDENCYDEYEEWRCGHTHCFGCGGCQCPGYCDDYQTYNLRAAETGG